MIGAIKRRWKSKKAKVLHKGNDLSSSSDSCPTSRGFVDGPEDFDKMIKPPSPRQVHPVLDKGDLKFGQFHNLHHLLQQNNGNTPNTNHSYILQQPPSGKKKSSTLPAPDDPDKGSQDGCHFIRVNSGRIELVSKDSWKSADQSGNYSPSTNTTAAERFLNRHLKNDVRHSWCGSAIRPQHKIPDVPQQQQPASKRLSEDQQRYSPDSSTFRGIGSTLTNNNNNRIYPQEDAPPEGPLHHPVSHQPASSSSASDTPDGPPENPAGGTGLLSPLRERLAAIEELTTSLQSWQTTEKTEYEKCVSDLANQVSRAVALQQLMKSEVEKLQQRVVDLENHNKAMATMIIPTLMKLHDTVGIKEGPQLKSIEAAPETTTTMTPSDITPETGIKSLELSSAENNDGSSSGCIKSPGYFIGGGAGMNAICYESGESSSNQSGEGTAGKSSTASLREAISGTTTTTTTSSDLQQPTTPQPLHQSSVLSGGSTKSPVKAPRSRVDCRIPRMSGSSTSSLTGGSPLSRSNSCNSRHNNQSPQVISLIEGESGENQSQISNSQQPETTSLESSSTTGPISTETTNSRNSNNVSNNNSRTSSRTSLSSAIPRMSSPARTAAISKIPCGPAPTTTSAFNSPTPKPRRAQSATTASSSSNNNSPSSDTPHGSSKLPVRRAPALASSVSSRHPAATSKSLPANTNMGTAFQSMSKAPQGNKHSKSTFGFGQKKSGGGGVGGGPPSRNPGKGGKSNNNNNPSPSSATPTNLPEAGGGSGGNSHRSGSGGSNSVPTKPIKLGVATSAAATAIGIKAGAGKDEGYSTMSSEALAEQEHTLEKPTQHRVSSSSNNSEGRPSLAGKSGNNVLPPSSSGTQVASNLGEEAGAKRNSIHKSNTFNTFREIDGGGGGRVVVVGGKCDTSYESCSTAEYRSGSKMSTTSGSSEHSRSSTQPRSLSSSGSRTKVSAHHKPSSKSSKDRVTTTRMKDGNIVRIVRGSPYSIRFGEESGDDMEDEEDPSSSTILWEDSDDSDILFLPLEVSAGSANSSHSTLVPPPQSSGESRSYYSSWGASSAASTTTGTVSTLEKGSNGSVNTMSNTGSSNTYSKRAYPLRRTKGEVTVDILLVNNSCAVGSVGGGGGVVETSSSQFISSNEPSSNNSISRKYRSSTKGYGAGGGGGGQLVINNPNSAHHDHDDNPTTDEMEERAFIEKWMQLEEVRNEQVQGEEWAWDWDGVERTYTRVLRNAMTSHAAILRGGEAPLDLNDVDLDVDLILEGDHDSDQVNQAERRNNELNDESSSRARSPKEIDSSTWTKSKARRQVPVSNKDGGEKEKGKDEKRKGGGSNSQEASPEKVREGDAILIVLEGERDEMENDGDRLLIKRRDRSDDGGDKLSPGNGYNPAIINLDENGIVVNSIEPSDGGEADGEDDPPPVIEFTPEFYRLANYGSNLSFSDNESSLTSPNSSATQSPKVSNALSGNNRVAATSPNSAAPLKNSPKRRKPARRSHSMNNSSNATPPVDVPSPPSILQLKTDDKISQTDFSCSSLENMSSVSSELSAECRNCLEIIKKLVDHGETDEGEGGSGDFRAESEENGALEKRGGGVDGGSFATTWISVPKGLPSAEVDRILEILSSSESEGILSPSK